MPSIRNHHLHLPPGGRGVDRLRVEISSRSGEQLALGFLVGYHLAFYG